VSERAAWFEDPYSNQDARRTGWFVVRAGAVMWFHAFTPAVTFGGTAEGTAYPSITRLHLLGGVDGSGVDVLGTVEEVAAKLGLDFGNRPEGP